MEEHTQTDHFMELDDPNDRLDPIKDKFKALEDITLQIHNLKVQKNDLKKDLVALVEPIEILDANNKFVTGFKFHPFIMPLVTQADEGKSVSAVLEFDEFNVALKLQSQKVVDWNDFHKTLDARKEVEKSNSTGNEEAVLETIEWVEDQIVNYTKSRTQSRIVTKTR
jgi:hypothetical protein